MGQRRYSTDVTNEIQSAALSETPVSSGNISVDGIYSLELHVTAASVGYESLPAIVLVDPVIRSYISKFWAKHACATSTERQKGIYDVVSKLEAMWSGLNSLSVVNDRPGAADTLRIIQKTIDLNKTYLQ